jgi:hypothetical protein
LKDRARDSIKEHGKFQIDAFAELAARLQYIDGDYNDPGTYESLRQTLANAQRRYTISLSAHGLSSALSLPDCNLEDMTDSVNRAWGQDQRASVRRGSKQPHFKFAAVRLERVEEWRCKLISTSVWLPKANVFSRRHAWTLRVQDAGIRDGCRMMAQSSGHGLDAVDQLREVFGGGRARPVNLVGQALFHGLRSGGVGLIRDLHDLTLLANQSLLSWTALYQGLRARHDTAAEAISEASIRQLELEISRLTTEIKDAAPQALTISPPRMNRMIGTLATLAVTARHPQRPASSLLKAAVFMSVAVFGYILGRRAGLMRDSHNETKPDKTVQTDVYGMDRG